ncbi:MAG: response regulator [Anaerolineae bacterium]|nr:response regulator [Anaerolineae bacterium]
MPRALIVDDAIDLGRLLQAALSISLPNMLTSIVPSAEEAMLEATREPPIDLLITDIRLPGMTGLELVQKIRKRIPQLKVIMITGLTDDTLVDQAKALNVNEFLLKPMDISVFVETVRNCLGIEVAAEAQPTAQEESALATPRGLSEVLAQLCQEIPARGVLLLDERGRLVAQSGDMPFENFSEQWAAPIMAALNTSIRLARLMDMSLPGNLQMYQTAAYYFILAAVVDFALILIIDVPVARVSLEHVIQKTFDAQAELLCYLQKQGLVSAEGIKGISEKGLAPAGQPPPEAEEIESPEAVAALGEILSQAAGIRLEEAESFWSSAEHNLDIEPASPDVLTYEQAKKLGLAPEI